MASRPQGRSQSLQQQIDSTVGGNQGGRNLPDVSPSLRRQIDSTQAPYRQFVADPNAPTSVNPGGGFSGGAAPTGSGA